MSTEGIDYASLAEYIAEEVDRELRHIEEDFLKQLRMEQAGNDLIKRWVIEAGLDK